MSTAPRIGRVDGLAFEVAGDGPPLLLLHEGIGDRGSWEGHWGALCERFTAIRYDARGFGESADPAAPYHLHSDALTVLRAAGFDRAAAVMGVSMGGATVLDLALEHPEAVERAVLVSTTPDGRASPPDLIARWEEVDRLVEAGDIPGANEIELQIWVDGVGRDRAEVERRRPRRSRGRQRHAARKTGELRARADGARAAIRGTARRAGRNTHPRHHRRVRPAVRVRCRAHDRRRGRRRGDRDPEAAHLPALEQPAAFAAAVLPFLDRG